MTKRKRNGNGNGNYDFSIISNHNINSNLYNFQAKTENQKIFIRSIIENIVTICYGFSGSGKSMCSIGVACQQLKKDAIENIVLVKPITVCGNEIGVLPGSVNERIHPYMHPVLEYFEYFLGKQNCLSLLNRKIFLFPVELIRGHTYHNSIMILEEAQNCTPQQIKLFMSRIGQNSKIVIIGDNKQSDIYNNGLQFCIENFAKMRNVGIVEFDKHDVLRNNIIPDIIEVFEKNGV